MAAKNSGKDSRAVNRWFRARIIFQGLTVATIVAGSFQMQHRRATHQETAKEHDREKERAEFEERMRAAEEAHAYEKTMEKPSEEKGIFERLGLGRGSLKSREAALKATATPSPAVVEPPPSAVVAPTTDSSPTAASAATTSTGSWSNWVSSK
jgi:hypothetical protein